MRYSIALGLLGALPLAFFRPPEDTSIQPTLVKTESIRIIDLTDRTFRDRWASVIDLPPAMIAQEIPLPPPRPEIKLKPRSSSDLCARHGLRKVSSGRRWRCKR